VETQKLKEKLFISHLRKWKWNTNSALRGTGGNILEPRQKVMAILIGVAIVTLSVQVVTASTDCPTCKVVYDGVLTENNGASAPHDATNAGPLSLLDPSTAFTSPSQVNIADTVLKLL